MNHKDKMKGTIKTLASTIFLIVTLVSFPTTTKVIFEEDVVKRLMKEANQTVITFVMILEKTDDQQY